MKQNSFGELYFILLFGIFIFVLVSLTLSTSPNNCVHFLTKILNAKDTVLWVFFVFMLLVLFPLCNEKEMKKKKTVAKISKTKSLSFFFFFWGMPVFLFLFIFLNFILFLNFTLLYWFCQILKWIRHKYTCVPHPEPASLLPPQCFYVCFYNFPFFCCYISFSNSISW